MTQPVEEESWAQSMITITPEDDAVIRTVTSDTVLAGDGDTPLRLDVSNIADRRTVITIRKDFVDPGELEKKEYVDVECQTYLQGVPKVDIPAEYRNEATQTLYLGKICPTLQPFKDIIANMNEKTLPEMKIGEITQTIVTFTPDLPQDDAIDLLEADLADEQQADPNLVVKSNEEEEKDMEITDNLNFLVDRVFWLSDPGYVPQKDESDAETQTVITYNYGLKRAMLDEETQTNLTCEPKDSHTKMLADYQGTKDTIRGFLEDCLEDGVYPLIMVDEILDELVDRGAEQIHLPPKEVAVQTLAPCKALSDKDDEVLRKLRLPIIVDPLESSIVVIPLLGELLETVCMIVHDDAPGVVQDILGRVVKKAVSIGTKLEQIRTENIPKPIEDIFTERKKRLEDSAQKTEMKDNSTQTGLAGVPDIKKIREPRETICSTCARHSQCRMCMGNLEEEEEEEEEGEIKKPQEIKILRTQDILLAYNPCYIMATPSEQVKNPHLIPICPPKEESKKPPPPPKKMMPKPKPVTSESSEFIDMKPVKKIVTHEDSLCGWANVVDTSLSRAWSVHVSASDDSKKVSPSAPSSCDKLLSKQSAKSQGGLAMQSVKALHILKTTFCTNETCCKATKEPKFEGGVSSGSSKISKQFFCTEDTCESFDKIDDHSHFIWDTKIQHKPSKIKKISHRVKGNTLLNHTPTSMPTSPDSVQDREKRKKKAKRKSPEGDGFRIIPILLLPERK